MTNLDKLIPMTQASSQPIPLAAVEHLLEIAKKKGYQKNARRHYVLDLTRKSGFPRLHCYDTKTETIKSVYCAHGAGSDPDNDGDVDSVGSVPNSRKSSTGVFLIAETYTGKHGLSCKLDGWEPSNKTARARSVVLHTAVYSTVAYVKKNGKCGRSWGCPAVGTDHAEIIPEAADGSLLVIWFGGK